MSEKILVTGCAGFIGMHLSKRLLEAGYEIYGVDNMNSYYDISLKYKRLKILKGYKGFTFGKIDICNKGDLRRVFESFQPFKVVNLAAQAGVNYSIKNPFAYIESNIFGFMNVLQCCKNNNIEGLIYASSSSVYGANGKDPQSVHDEINKPQSIYSVTKRTNELMAFSFNHLFGLKSTGLRFFTVYGEWGRPDMAMYIFLKKIYQSALIPVYNFGDIYRDFTYIGDIIDGIISSIDKNYNYEIFNLGNGKPEHIMNVIKIIELEVNIKANIDFQKIKNTDIKSSNADIKYTTEKLGFMPKTTIEKGVPTFIKWFQKYHNIKV